LTLFLKAAILLLANNAIYLFCKRKKPIKAAFLVVGGKDYLFELKQEFLQRAIKKASRVDVGSVRCLNHSLTSLFEFIHVEGISSKELRRIEQITFDLLYTFKVSLAKDLGDTKKTNRRISPVYTLLRDSDFPNEKIPKVNANKTTPLEPYAKSTLDQLVRALRKEMRRFKDKEKQVERALLHGSLITFNISKYFADNSLENICYLYKYVLNEVKPHWKERTYFHLYNGIKKCPDKNVSQLGVVEFTDAYVKNNWSVLADSGRLQRGQDFHKEQFCIEDVLLTFHSALDEALTAVNINFDLKEANSSLELLSLRLKRSGHPSKSILKEVIIGHAGSYDDFKSYVYPNMEEVLCMFMFIAIQTGWNPETIAVLDADDFEHALSQSIDGNTAIISSTKSKGQTNSNDLNNRVKIIHSLSSTSDMYSALNLIKLVKKRTSRIRSSKIATNIISTSEFDNPLFFYASNGFVSYLKPGLRGNSYRSIQNFLQRYKIFEPDGNRLKSIDLRRIRPTWREAHHDRGTDDKLVTMLMGHAAEITTDTHYDNHSVAKLRRKKRLARELIGIVEDLDTGAFKGFISVHKNARTVSSIVQHGHVFTDENERYICICLDSKSPTWEGSDKAITKGQLCTFLTKCLLCEQCVVTVETLPYIVDRGNYISKQRTRISSYDFKMLFGKEKTAIDSLLESWPNQEQIEDAIFTAITDGPLLPADLQIPIVEI